MALNLRALAVALSSMGLIFVLFIAATGPLRSFFGDVVVVVFLVASLGALNLGRSRSRLVGVGLFAFGIEMLQGLHLVAPGAHWLLDLTVGSTTDPLDLLAYALGLLVSAGAERWYGRG